MLLSIGPRQPRIDPSAWIAADAVVVGDVTIGAGSSIWYGTVIRADVESISIGAGTNIQDGSILHADPGLPLTIDDHVTIGHGARLHGCRIADSVLIGIGAIVLNGASVGRGSLVAAGAVVSEGTVVPAGSLVMGVPARVRRSTTAEELTLIETSGAHYTDLADAHRSAASRLGPRG